MKINKANILSVTTQQDIMQYYAEQFRDAIMRLKNFGEAKEVTEANRVGLVRVPKS